MKKACFSNVRDPHNRSEKDCVCGGHSQGARMKRKVWSRAGIREVYGANTHYGTHDMEAVDHFVSEYTMPLGMAMWVGSNSEEEMPKGLR